MTLEIALVLAVTLGAVALFVSDRLPVDLVGLLVMATLLTLGLVTPEEGVAGFSNTATVTVGAMFVLSAALVKTGAVNALGALLDAVGRRNWWLGALGLMLVTAALSAFVNNTAVVAIFMPVVLSVSQRLGTSPSRLLMPLSFASMFGGVCTLIGTSTNILVSSIAERNGEPAIRMFELAPIGLIFCVAGLAYMLTVGIRLIPDRRADEDLTESFGIGRYLTEISLTPEAGAVGERLMDWGPFRDGKLDVLEIRRASGRLVLPLPDIRLSVDDTLRVRGGLEEIRGLHQAKGVTVRPNAGWNDAALSSEDCELVEAVVAPNSRLEGRTLGEARLRERFGASPLAVRHREKLLHESIESAVLAGGDVLLLEVQKIGLERLFRDPAFVFITRVPGLERLGGRALLGGAIVVATVAIAAAGWAPIVVTSVVGCVALIVAGCLTLDEVYEAIQWRVIFLLAGVLTLAAAMERSGTAALLAQGLLNAVGDRGPRMIVAALFFGATMLTNVMSNNATAALLTPLALAAAVTLDIDPRPLLITIALAASLSFMTPVGYQTNILIYGPGKYRFSDFLKVGTPLNILLCILGTIFIPVFFPFSRR